MTLDDVIQRLRHRDEIDGLMIVGSAARNEVGPTSDYDLFILMSTMPVPIEMGQTYVDGRITDLKFLMVEEMDKLIAAEEPINPYTGNGRAFLRMGDGRIELDRSGRLERAQQKVLAGVPLRLFTEQEKYSRWYWMNGFLRLTQRLVVSDDPLVTQAAELMLMGQLDFLMTDYFNFRDLLFKGEKEAIKYWSSQDPSFLRSFMECLREPDPSRKLALYEELTAIAAAPVGDIWKQRHTVMSIRLDPESESDIGADTERALDFWDRLVEESDI